MATTFNQKDLTLAELLDTPFVRCDYCSNIYTSPVILPCLHTFCLQCVTKITAQENIKLLQTVRATSGRNEDSTKQKVRGENNLTNGKKHEQDRFGMHCPTCRSQISFERVILENSVTGEGVSEENDKKAEMEKKNSKDKGNAKEVIIPATSIKLMKNAICKSLPVNYFLESITRLYRHKKDIGRECAYCKTEDVIAEATCLCLQCGDDVCEGCASAHRKTRVTREHSVIAYSAIHQGLFDHDIRAAGSYILCGTHSESAVTHFCTDCSKVVCKLCLSKTHFGHTTLLIKDASTKLAPEIVNVQQGLSRRVPDLSDYINFLSQQIKTLKQRHTRTLEEIDEQAQLIHRMVEDWKAKAISNIESTTSRERKAIDEKIVDMKTTKTGTEKTATFLLNISNLGNAGEKMALYAYVMRRYQQLLQVKPKAMTSQLGISFTPGPTTDQNIRMLIGKLGLKREALSNKDTPKSRLSVSSLMPAINRPPCLVKSWTISTGPSETSPTMAKSLLHSANTKDNKNVKTSDACAPCYISGIDIKGNMLAAVDRENAKVIVVDLNSQSILKEITGSGENKLQAPFDVVFLPSGAIAVTDPEVSAIRVFDWTGKFIFTFEREGNISADKEKTNQNERGRLGGESSQSRTLIHPRGITVNKKGEVVVVDGHFRRCTIYDGDTGRFLRVITPYRETAQDNDQDYLNKIMDMPENGTGDKESSQPSSAISQIKQSSPNPILVDPFYVATTSVDNLVITDAASPNVKIIRHDGLVLEESMDYGTHAEESLHPAGVCVDKSGYIFLADTFNSRIHLGLPDGQFSDILLPSKSGADLSHPISLSFDQDDNLVIVQVEGKIHVYKYL